MKKGLFIFCGILIFFLATPKIAAAAGIGEACTGDADCSGAGPNVYCTTIASEQLCLRVQPGISCGSNADCDPGATCNLSTHLCTGSEPTGPLLESGQECSPQVPCQIPGNQCINNLCYAPIGAVCLNDTECVPGARCLRSAASPTGQCFSEPPGEPAGPGIVFPRLQIPVPGIQPFTVRRTAADEKVFLDINFLAEYLAGIYTFLVGIVGVTAGVMIVWAGVKWLTSGGNAERIGDSKKKIASALVGMILVLGSYVILRTINPGLVILKPLRVQFVERIELEEADHGGGELRAGAGATDPYRLQSCDGFATNGQEFQAYFTHYHKPSPYGSADGYEAAWILENTFDPSSGITRRDPDPNSAFFCAVAMECSCPSGAKDNTKRCYSGPPGSTYSKTGRRHGWAPCVAFDDQTPYCNHPEGLTPGETVAADRDCFYVRAGCELLVDGTKTVRIIDSGSGIRGKRFDLFTSGPENDGGIAGGVHTVKVTNPGQCRPCLPGEYAGKCTTGQYRGGVP